MHRSILSVAILLCACTSDPSARRLSDDDVAHWVAFRTRVGCDRPMLGRLERPPLPAEDAWAEAEGFDGFAELLAINARISAAMSGHTWDPNLPAMVLSLVPIDKDTAAADDVVVSRHRAALDRVCPPILPPPPWPEPPPVVDATRVGGLTIGSKPMAIMTVDGRVFGTTPFAGPRRLTLPLGAHRVELTDKVRGRRYRYIVTVNEDGADNLVSLTLDGRSPPKVEGAVSVEVLTPPRVTTPLADPAGK